MFALSSVPNRDWAVVREYRNLGRLGVDSVLAGFAVDEGMGGVGCEHARFGGGWSGLGGQSSEKRQSVSCLPALFVVILFFAASALIVCKVWGQPLRCLVSFSCSSLLPRP